MSVELQRPHVDILPCNDTLFGTCASDARGRIGLHFASSYHVARVQHNHSWSGRKGIG